MIQSAGNTAIETEADSWDIEIDYDEQPQDPDSDVEFALCKVLGPDGNRFTYKVRFSKTVVATEGLGLGTVEERIESALRKSEELIKQGQHSDIILTRLPSIWEISDSPYRLLKHS